MAVNVRGTFLCCTRGSTHMPNGGSIVNVASTTALTGSQGFLHYVASKGAVISMTRALAYELGRATDPRQLRRPPASRSHRRFCRARSLRPNPNPARAGDGAGRSARHVLLPARRRFRSSSPPRPIVVDGGRSRTDLDDTTSSTPRRMAGLVQSGEVHPRELVDAGDRADRAARSAAQRHGPPPIRAGPRRRRAGRPISPFRGVPFLFKDYR